MYSHTENIVIVTDRNVRNEPSAWAITGTREVDSRGREIRRHDYQRPMPCHRDGTRIV